MSTIVLQRLRYNGMRKSWTRTFKAVRRRQKGFTIPFSRDKWMIQKTKKAIWSEAEETEKYIFTYYRHGSTTYNAPYICSDRTLRAKSTYHRARCLLQPVLYGINRRLIGYSGVLRSDYAVLVVCPEYLQNGPTRHGASFHGTASLTNVNSIGRVTWTAISNWPNVCTCFAILGF